MTDLALPPPITAPPLDVDRFAAYDMFPCRSKDEATVHRIINRERSKRGLSPLMTSRILTATAKRWAQLMAEMGSVAHAYGPTEALTQIRRAGYPNSYLGQNLCAGQPSPDDAVTAWLASPGHRESMLSRHFTEMGVGFYHDPDSRYRWYYCCDFGGADTPPARRCRQ